MFKKWIRTISSLALLSACSVSQPSHTPRFLLPFLDSEGHEQLREVELKTLSSPDRAEGMAAKVYIDVDFDGQFRGDVAHPHLARSGDLYIPTDAASGAVLATYSFFERMHDFENRVLVHSDISWPRTVGIFRKLKGVNSNEANAEYMGMPQDVYGVLPFADGSHVDLMINDGVMAHEHCHAHWERWVNQLQKELVSIQTQDSGDSYQCPKSDTDYKVLVFRGWNEGIADFCGAVFSGRPSFIAASVPQLTRDVGADAVPMTDDDSIRQFMVLNQNRSANCNSVNPYREGLQLARVLYRMAANGDFPEVQGLDKWERAMRFVLERVRTMGQKLSLMNAASTNAQFPLVYITQGLHLSKDSCQTFAHARGIPLTCPAAGVQL